MRRVGGSVVVDGFNGNTNYNGGKRIYSNHKTFTFNTLHYDYSPGWRSTPILRLIAGRDNEILVERRRGCGDSTNGP